MYAADSADPSALGDSHIEVDSAPSDGYETDDAGSTGSTSMSSSVRDYVFENNRRYHSYKEGRYLLPNDDREQEREDMKHAMILHASEGKLHFAPLDNPQKILDLGTGTGIWAIDMGDEYPSSEVVGVDLSPIQSSWVPSNVKFYVDDIESDWVDAPDSLDYVHVRHLSPAVKDWPTLAARAYSAIKPGGWMEMQEIRIKPVTDDNSITDTYAYAKFTEYLKDAFAVFGIQLLAMEKNKSLLESAGFVNVTETVYKIPIGPWPKDQHLKTVGIYNRAGILDAIGGIGVGPFTRGLKWTPEEFETFMVGVRKSLSDPTVHAYFTYHAVYGQKPVGSRED